MQMNRGEMDEGELKERQARAMSDPEIQSILSDPVMRQVRARLGVRLCLACAAICVFKMCNALTHVLSTWSCCCLAV
jgi:hypothetical protein